MSKRSMTALAVVVGLGLAGCSTPPSSTPANLIGSHSLVRVGDLMFVTSSERNELRVLDLRAAIAFWKRAPNPLEPLSIPVLDRPISLARDVSYGEEAGRYVYATSSGTPAISIVASSEEELLEVARLVTPAQVTAIAGQAGADAASTLYYAVLTPGGSELYELVLPGPAELKAKAAAACAASEACSPPTVPDLAPRYLTSFPGELVSSILVISGQRLAVATRALTGSAGRALVLTPSNLSSFQLLNFPSRVRALFAPLDRPTTRVFGLLDEVSCGAAGGCSGVLAVDLATGNVAADGSGFPMLPIQAGGGLARGLAFAADQDIRQSSSGDPSPLALTGILTSSTGEITLFDAEGLRPIDTNTAPAAIGDIAYQTVTGAPLTITEGTGPGAEPSPPDGGVVADPDGGAFPSGPDGGTFAGGLIEVVDGAARDELIVIEYQGLIPGLAGLPTSDQDLLTFKASPAALARAAVDDIVRVGTAAQVDCELDLPVVAITADSLVVSGSPAPCPGRTTFSVLAAGTQPWVVGGTSSGYMGRTAAQSRFAYQGSYFYHPDGFNPARPQLAFTLGAVEPPPLARGNRYVLESKGNFQPLVATIAYENVLNQPCTTSLPGSVEFANPPPPGEPRAYIAYPSANGVLALDLSALGPGPTTNVFCYQ